MERQKIHLAASQMNFFSDLCANLNFGDIVSMPFELSMKDLFCGCDDKSFTNTKGPFSSNTRSLLVHSILNDLNFFKIKKNSGPSQESVKDDDQDDLKSHKGLEYLIKDNYFDDAFILHDDSRHFIHLVQLVDMARQTQLNDKQINDELNNKLPVSEKKVAHDGDVRHELYLDWAKLTNIFKTQPLSKIRRYFGESVAFYFAWIGTFIWTLILPSFIGFVFFIAGIYKNRKIIHINLSNNNPPAYNKLYAKILHIDENENLKSNTISSLKFIIHIIFKFYSIYLTQWSEMVYKILDSRKFDKTTVSNLNSTGLKSASIYGDYYLNIFADSFDNDMTPYFAVKSFLQNSILALIIFNQFDNVN
ncbi:anoctamin-4 [Brachionus plicatilis]|uniref:Anoctamin n=1 Tax=Brachionus plicatilis TaxID=10195 RepID=A0A3M7SPC6_BRAPC|nr:anoctamin-4 [Brachionus plicatilis]